MLQMAFVIFFKPILYTDGDGTTAETSYDCKQTSVLLLSAVYGIQTDLLELLENASFRLNYKTVGKYKTKWETV